MDKEQVTLTIDGKTVTVPKGMVAVDAAKTVDIDIPVFCYHEKLGPFGCCRMCLVEVEKMPKLATACTLNVSQDMVIKTDTPKVKKGRNGVLEFTLLNHPLDCPVCDKGGECPLQDNTFEHGPDLTRMEYNRAHHDKATPLSPVITIDRERCIACQRCTRYSDIIEKDTALVMLNRGFHNEVGTFNNEPYDTRFSGNVVDICPVGALTNTQYRFKSRNWDLKNAESLCAHCACNCNIVIGTRQNRFMRVQAKSSENSVSNDFVDDGWICDKGRFGYQFLESKNRILDPRENGIGDSRAGVIETAKKVAASFKKIAEEHGPDSVGFLGSPFGTNEELYLYQKLFRLGLGTNNIDHKLYADSPGLPVDHYDMEDVESADLVLTIASDPTEELPILDLRLKKAVSSLGTKLAVLSDQQTLMDCFACHSLRYNVGSDGTVLQSLTDGLGKKGFKKNKGFETETGIESDAFKELIASLKKSTKVCVIYNPEKLTGDSVHILKSFLTALDKNSEGTCGAIPAAPATNALGAMDMGVLPDYYPGGIPVSNAAKIRELWGDSAPVTEGASASELIQKAESGELKALWIYRCNPLVDFPGGAKLEQALKKLDLLVVHDMLETETTRIAKVVLPSNGPGYDEGTTTNIGGRVQFRKRGIVTQNPADWKILGAMLKELDIESDYRDSFEVTSEIASTVPGYSEVNRKNLRKFGHQREKVSNPKVPESKGSSEKAPDKNALRLRVSNYLFAHDKILDASSSLAHHFQTSSIYIHEDDAKSLGLSSGAEVTIKSDWGEIKAEVQVNNRCNPGGALVPYISDEQGVASLLNPDGGPTWVTFKN